MNGAWRTISVALTMNTAGFTTGAGKAAVAARGLDRATGATGRTVDQAGARVGRSGRQWTTFGAAMAGAGRQSVGAGGNVRGAASTVDRAGSTVGRSGRQWATLGAAASGAGGRVKGVGGQASAAASTVDRAGSTVHRSRGRWGSWATAVTGAGRGVKGVGGQALLAAGEVAQAGARVEGSGSRWRTWGAMATKSAGVVGVAALVLGGLAVREAIKFESAFAGVEKTVDGTTAQMAQLSDGIVSMGNRMPASREEIAKVAEAAGQLGVKREDILGFTEVMVGMGSATNLSSDEAATGLARLMNIMGTAPADVERLGSALVDLGNKGASTESEILDMALRLAGAGKLIGASEPDILALANTMSSLGIKAQLGGGSFSRIMLKVYSAVQDGGDALGTFADVAGMSADQFAAAWQEDPILAIDSLIQGLAGIKESGGNVVAALDDMGIKGTENQQVMLSLLGAGDLLTESLDNGTAAWGRNNALADEVAKRYGTAESQLAIFRNQVTNVGREIGGILIPALLIAVDSIRDFAGWIGDQLPAASKLVGPIWDDLASTGENVVKILGHMWDAGGPIITLFAQLAGGAVIGTLTGIAEALEATTGYLADNEDAVRFLVVALGVLGANRAAVVAMDLFRGAMVRADGATVGLRSRMFLLGSGMSDVARNMAVVPDATNRMAPGVAQGVGKMREAFRGLGGAVTSVVSPAAILTVGIATLMTAQANAKRQAEELVEANKDIADSYDSAGIRDSIARTTQALDEQMREWQSYDGVGGLLQGTLEVLSPLENKVLDNAVAVDKLGDSLAELEGDQARLDQTTSVLGTNFGLTADQAEELLRRMDIDLESTSLANVVAQVNDELATLAGTDPKTEAIVEALTVVGDESESTTDKVEAFQDALDEVFAPEQNYHDAVSAYVAGFKEMQEALREGNGEMNVWRENGAAVHDSASSFFDDVKDRASAAVAKMVSAGVDYGSAVRIAAADTEAARQSIIDFGTDAGYTRDQMNELLSSLGWTQESIDLILSLQGGDATAEELAELQRQADEVGQEHMIGVEADTDDAVAGMGNVRDILARLIATDPELAMTLDSSDPVGKMAALEAGLEVFLTGDMANPTLKAWMDTTDPVEKQRLLGEFLVWYDNSNAIATASMDTIGARLGFTDVSRWSAYLDSLTPTAKADLLADAARGEFTGLFDAAGRWRRETPVATAGLNTDPAHGGFGGLWSRALGWAGAAPVGTAGLNTNPAQGGFGGLWSRSLGWAGNVTTAAAGLNTTSAALGFSDVGRYSAYYNSLTPTAQARLDKAAADGNFAAVFAEASRWREQNPTARAQLDTLGSRIGFSDVGRFAAYYDSLTPTAKADLHREAANGNFDALFDRAGRWRRENPNTTAKVSGVDGVERALNFVAREREARVTLVESKGPGWTGSGSSAGEPQTKRRWGGIDHYASGGIRDAKIGRGDLVHWAEPATEAEGYIPKRGDRGRSLSVLGEVASWFDMTLIGKDMAGKAVLPMARGGVLGDVVQGATDGPAGDWMDSQAGMAEQWAQRVRESVEAGYDPGLIASTLEAGPAQAAPILDGAVADLVGTHDAMARTNLGTVGRIGAETGAAAEWTRAGVVGTAGEMAAGVVATGQMMAAGATDAAGRMAAGVSAGADGAANLVTAHTGRMTLNVAGSTEVMRATAVDTTGRMALGVVGNTESMGLAAMGSAGRMALGVAGSTESMAGAATGNVGGMAMGVASLTDTMERTATGNVNRMADNMVAGTNRGVDAAVAKLFAGSVQAGSITRSYAGSLAGALNPVLTSVGKPPIKLNTGGYVPGPNVDADVVDARLTPGEYVLTRDMTQDFGIGNLEAWRRGYNKGGQVTGDTEGMHPVLMDRLRSWSGAVGAPYNIGSGYRSIDEQKRLYALYLAGRGNLAAKPGSSMHNYGLASDGPHWGARNPGAFGLRYAVPGEPWHVEPIEAKKLRGGGVSSHGFVPPQMPTPPGVGPWPIGRTAEASMGYSHDAAAAFVAGMSVSADTPDLGPVGRGTNRELGRAMAARRGWTGSQWNALDRLWQNESGWDHTAQNPTSTAFGIAQFLNCVPLDTEILTRDGWKRHDEVKPGDETLGFNPETGRSEWTTIRHVVHKAPQEVVEIGSSRWSARVTPGHRWWSERRAPVPVEEAVDECPECGSAGGKRGPWVSPRAIRAHRAKAHGVESRPSTGYTRVEGFVRTDAITKAHSLILAAPADSGPGLPISDDEACLLGWLAGDGHVRLDKHLAHVTLYQSKPERLPEIRDLLDAIGIPHTESSRQRGNYLRSHQWYIHAEGARDLLKRADWASGVEAGVRQMSSSQRTAWLDGMVAAEGSAVRSGPDGEKVRIPQNNGDVCDAIVLATYMEGFRPSRRRKTDRQSVVTMARPAAHGATLERGETTVEPVWCVQTDLGTWTMRQDGQVSLTGNSTWAGVGHRKTGDAAGQIAAGLDYIGGRYGNPGAALAFWNSKSPHWYNAGGLVRSYDQGGMMPTGLSLSYNGTGRPEPVGHDLVHVPPPVVNVAAPHVQVFVGNEEITGMVQVVIDGHDRRGARLARAGERR